MVNGDTASKYIFHGAHSYDGSILFGSSLEPICWYDRDFCICEGIINEYLSLTLWRMKITLNDVNVILELSVIDRTASPSKRWRDNCEKGFFFFFFPWITRLGHNAAKDEFNMKGAKSV